MSDTRRRIWVGIALAAALVAGASEAGAAGGAAMSSRRHVLETGVGFSGNVTGYAPGGFKWFNDYGFRFTQLIWLDAQFNLTIGGSPTCIINSQGQPDCSLGAGDRAFKGKGIELAAGVKMGFPLVQNLPLFIHAKAGGAVDIIFFNDITGASFGLRGGAGVRYFFTQNLGAGAEVMFGLGPSFLGALGNGVFFAVDLNFGIEWRFM